MDKLFQTQLSVIETCCGKLPNDLKITGINKDGFPILTTEKGKMSVEVVMFDFSK